MNARFVYVGIRVKNLQESIDFYTKLLGMTVSGRGRYSTPRGEVVHLRSEDSNFTIELNHYDQDSPHNTPYTLGEELDHLAFKVDNLDKALEEAHATGYPTVLEVRSNGGRWAYIEDPNGIWIELY